jgi:hypothetical protein
MINRVCDRYGLPIMEGELRYIAKIQVFAAYDPLEITFEDLTWDHTQEIERLIEACQDLSEEELMRDVHVEFQYDLCRPCQKVYVAKPMPFVDGTL